jgi:hypothetical protein
MGFVMRRARFYALIFSSFACQILLMSWASAATITAISGKVSLNRGNGFRQITVDASASPGDLVMAGPSASAIIVYDDGCRQTVGPGSVVPVAQSTGGRDGGSVKDAHYECPTAIPRDHLLLGAAVIGGGIAAVVAITETKPSSSQ